MATEKAITMFRQDTLGGEFWTIKPTRIQLSYSAITWTSNKFLFIFLNRFRRVRDGLNQTRTRNRARWARTSIPNPQAYCIYSVLLLEVHIRFNVVGCISIGEKEEEEIV